ncbi:zinc knuckle CX2CX4HX4C containing protein [Tanacetum coccineum]
MEEMLHVHGTNSNVTGSFDDIKSNEDTIVALFGVPLSSIEDVDALTRKIEACDYDDIKKWMTSVDWKAVMGAIEADRFLSKPVDSGNEPALIGAKTNTCEAVGVVHAANAGKELAGCMSNVDATARISMSSSQQSGSKFRPVEEATIIQYVSIQPNPYAGATGVVKTYYARNNWGKFGLTRIMMNSKGFFFFKLTTTKGLEDVLKNGPWMICNIPIILKKWSMNTRLCKEELTRIPPIMLDSFTSSMCIEMWGRSSFARCLIEVNVDDILKESLTMGVPLIEDSGFSIETKVTITPIAEKANDGFQSVANKRKKGKTRSTNGGKFGGQSIKQSVRYEPKAATNVPMMGASNVVNESKSGSSNVSSMSKIQPLKAIVPLASSRRSPNVDEGGNIIVSNSYDALDDDSDEEVKNMFDESANLLNST